MNDNEKGPVYFDSPFHATESPEVADRMVIVVDKMLRVCEELDAVFGDFFDTYNVTEKDKYELMARLVEWESGVIK